MSQSASTSSSSLADVHKREPTVCSSEDKKKLTSMISDIEFCMLTTQDKDGRLHSRPMAMNKEVECTEDVCAIWFFTYESSHKVSEMNSHGHQVNLSFSDPKKQSYVSVSGTGQINKDKTEMSKRWQAPYKAWFPEGLDTPGIALLRVTIEKAEYWDAPSSSVAHALSFIKGQLTGTPADPAQHKSVLLTSKPVEHKETMRGEEGKMKDI